MSVRSRRSRRPLPSALLTGTLLIVVPATWARQDDPARALADGRFAEAEAEYRARLVEDPTSRSALVGRARALAGLGRSDEAVASLRRAGEGSLRRADYESAASLFEIALEIAPGDAALRARLGQTLVLGQRYVAAEPQLRTAWEGGVRDPRSLLYFGACLWETGEMEEAEARYREAVERSGGAPPAEYELGRLLLWQGRAEEALEPLHRAVTGGLGGAAPVHDLARALERAGRDDPSLVPKAVNAYRRAAELAPEDYQVRYGLARTLMQAGETAAAQEQLQIYRRLYGEDQERTRESGLVEARSARARELVADGQVDAALELLEPLPEAPEVWHARALAYRARGETDAAIEALERALALDAERHDLAALLAELRSEAR